MYDEIGDIPGSKQPMLPRELLLDLGHCKRVVEVQGQREVVVPVPWAVHMALEVIQLPFVP